RIADGDAQLAAAADHPRRVAGEVLEVGGAEAVVAVAATQRGAETRLVAGDEEHVAVHGKDGPAAGTVERRAGLLADALGARAEGPGERLAVRGRGRGDDAVGGGPRIGDPEDRLAGEQRGEVRLRAGASEEARSEPAQQERTGPGLVAVGGHDERERRVGG